MRERIVTEQFNLKRAHSMELDAMANHAETTQSEFLRVFVETAVLALVTSGLMLAATSATTAQRSKPAMSVDHSEWAGSNQLVQSKLIVEN